MGERTTPEDLHRLLDKAHREGCQRLPTTKAAEAMGWHRVNSSRAGQEPYIVCTRPGHPLHGCDCEGYERHGRCKHYALCLDAAGLLPDLELPLDDAPVVAEERGPWWELTEKGRQLLAAMGPRQVSGTSGRDERRERAMRDLTARGAA